MKTPPPYLLLPPLASLSTMRHQETMPFSTFTPPPISQLPLTEPPVSATFLIFEPSLSVATRSVAVCLMIVPSHPWPWSVTPFVTISCASISKVPAPRVTVPTGDWAAASSIAAWIACRVPAGVAPGWIVSARAEPVAQASAARIACLSLMRGPFHS